MATGSSASLPFLPPELWRMIVLNFQSVDDFEDLHYVSTQLRSVSRLFKVTVEAFRPLASLFSSAEVKIPESSCEFFIDLNVLSLMGRAVYLSGCCRESLFLRLIRVLGIGI